MSKINLIESHFDLGHPFETAVLCSYGLDLNFLENYLLSLGGLGGCDTIALFVDADTYDHFSDRNYPPRWLNRRYLVTPIRSSGIFHSKLYILASPRRAVVTIGSANLTRDGIAGNLELLTTFAVTEKHGEHSSLLRDALDYVRRIAQLSGSQQAIEQVETLVHVCMPLASDSNHPGDVRLIHNLDRPILETILTTAADMPVTRAHILSPFYDALLQPLASLRNHWPGLPVTFFIQQAKSNFPTARLEWADPTLSVALFDNLDRYLHGKAIILETGREALVFTGSANFTRSALLTRAGDGNFEIGLIGRVSLPMARELLRPVGSEAKTVHSVDDIRVDLRDEPQPVRTTRVDYIIEATQEKSDTIRVSVRPDVTAHVFQPQRYRLHDSAGMSFEGPYGKDNTIVPDSKIRRKLRGLFTVQLIGLNDRGETLLSNRVWVIALETATGDRTQRMLRRASQDPTQLLAVLQEIAHRGDERELMLFLKQYDIPLDLIVLPLVHGRPRSIQSKGNLIGLLPARGAKFLSSNVLMAYDDCLSRLMGKMRRHHKELQPERTGNYTLIYANLLTLLLYLNEWTSKRYEVNAIITSDDWRAIRDCYDMLVRYCSESWDLTWAKGGYREAIQAKMAIRQEDDEENLPRFDDLLLAYFDNSRDQFLKALFSPLETFAELHERLRVRSPSGPLVQPKIFPTNHPYLQHEKRETVRTQQIQRTRHLLAVSPQL